MIFGRLMPVLGNGIGVQKPIKNRSRHSYFYSYFEVFGGSNLTNQLISLGW